VMRDFASTVQQARATLEWMGTHYEVAVAVDFNADVSSTAALLVQIRQRLEQYRRIGHVLRVSLPKYAPLSIDVIVCVTADYLRAHVRKDLLDRFSNHVLTDGTKGFFHPDNFGFGDSLYLSRLITEIKKVRGVENMQVTKFQRQGAGDQGELQAGLITFGPLEIPRLDNDPLHPENGCLCFTLRGER
jgi:hypothetical protein